MEKKLQEVQKSLYRFVASPGSSDAMDIILRVVRIIEIDHVLYVIDI